MFRSILIILRELLNFNKSL